MPEQKTRDIELSWRKIHLGLRLCFLGLLLLLVVSIYKSDDLPPVEDILRQVHLSPVQKETDQRPFTQKIDDRNYVITPKASYELTGLVVSVADLDRQWFNIYYKEDPLNIRDFCVIWGGNVARDDYQKVRFSSGVWTCFFEHGFGVSFNPHELSNNHILPAHTDIADKLRETEVGDQIRLQGLLVDYELPDKGRRPSSLIRNDTDDGACEVVYVMEFDFLKRGNVLWRLTRDMTKWLAIAVFLGVCVTYFLYDFRLDHD